MISKHYLLVFLTPFFGSESKPIPVTNVRSGTLHSKAVENTAQTFLMKLLPLVANMKLRDKC